jgi:hypothetical protein
VKFITGGWDDATNAIADWDLALLPVSRRSESSRHPLAIKFRVTALTGNYHGPEVGLEEMRLNGGSPPVISSNPVSG